MPNVVRVVSQDKVIKVITAGATRTGSVSLAHSDLTGLTTGDPHPQYVLDADLSAANYLPTATADADYVKKVDSTYEIRLNADVVNNNGTANTIADVTGLSFPVVSGTMYRFRFVIIYTAAATTTGSRWAINGPANTLLTYRSEYSLTATSRTVNDGLTAYDQPAASNATSLTTGNMAIIEGIIQPSANGNVIARFASEVASSAITAKAGSHVEYRII